jgi:hypothetical protein
MANSPDLELARKVLLARDEMVPKAGRVRQDIGHR